MYFSHGTHDTTTATSIVHRSRGTSRLSTPNNPPCWPSWFPPSARVREKQAGFNPVTSTLPVYASVNDSCGSLDFARCPVESSRSVATETSTRHTFTTVVDHREIYNTDPERDPDGAASLWASYHSLFLQCV